MEAHVRARAEQMTKRRTREESAEPGELGIARLDRDDAALIVDARSLRKRTPGPSDRPAEGGAELVSPEERIGIERVTAQTRIGRQVMVSIERRSRCRESRCRPSASRC